MYSKTITISFLLLMGMLSISQAHETDAPADKPQPTSITQTIVRDHPNTPRAPDSFYDNPIENQIRSFYTQILGRQPDPEGVRYWLKKYNEGMPMEEIRTRFAATANLEYNNNPFSQHQRDKQTPFLPCQSNTCGGFPQNVADIQAGFAVAVVPADGQLLITLRGLTWINSGQVVAQKTMEVHLGNFVPGSFNGSSIGFIKTDAAGNYQGRVEMAAGTQLICGQGNRHLMQIVLNDPSVRSEFYTVPVDCKLETTHTDPYQPEVLK